MKALLIFQNVLISPWLNCTYLTPIPSQDKAEGLRLWDYNFVSLFWVNRARDLYFVFQNVLKELDWDCGVHLLVLNSGSILDPEIFPGETGQCFLVKMSHLTI